MANTRNTSSQSNNPQNPSNPQPHPQPSVTTNPEPHRSDMANTRSTSSQSSNPQNPSNPQPHPQPSATTNPDILARLEARLEAIDILFADVAALKAQVNNSQALNMSSESNQDNLKGAYMGPYGRSRRRNWELEEDDDDTKSYNTTCHPQAKVNFHKFEGGDLHGWTLKAETQSRVSKSPYNPPNKHLSIPSYPTRFTSTLAPSQLQNNHNPSHAPFSSYNNQTRNQSQPDIPLTATQSWEYEKQVEYEKGLCFLSKEKFRPGHYCKSLGFSQMEINEESEAHDENEPVEAEIDEETSDLVEISFPATSRKMNGTTKKLQDSLRLKGEEDKITRNPMKNGTFSVNNCYVSAMGNEKPPLKPTPFHWREIWVKGIP